MIVSETIEAEVLKHIFKSVGKATINFETKVAKNPVRAFEIASKIKNAAAIKNLRATLATTNELIKFATMGALFFVLALTLTLVLAIAIALVLALVLALAMTMYEIFHSQIKTKITNTKYTINSKH